MSNTAQAQLFDEPTDDLELRFSAIRLRTVAPGKARHRDVLTLANAVDGLLDRIARLEQERDKWVAKQS